MAAYIRATWDVAPDFRIHIEAVHRLSDLGAVFTQAAHGTSQEGFEAEWRDDRPSDGRRRPDQPQRALRRGRPRRRTREIRRTQPAGAAAGKRGKPSFERFQAYFAARDWDAMAEILADDVSIDDRRRVVNAGIRHGRDAEIADMRAVADVGVTNMTSTVIATRGERLVLARIRFSGRDQQPEEFHIEVARHRRDRRRRSDRGDVVFDLDDIDAAFAELDARYLAGEAAAHAHTWSVIARAYAALNRRELPATTPDWVNIDHRRGDSDWRPAT